MIVALNVNPIWLEVMFVALRGVHAGALSVNPSGLEFMLGALTVNPRRLEFVLGAVNPCGLAFMLYIV